MKRSTEQLFLTQAAKEFLENQEQFLFFNLSRYQLWDLVGVDSRRLAKRLVGEVVVKMAACESIDVIFTGYQYSTLCLGEGHFRLGLYGELGEYGGLTFLETIVQASQDLQVWAKPCVVQPVALPETPALDLLCEIAIVNPPRSWVEHSNGAALGQIDHIPVLLWRHQLLSKPVVELHTAVEDTEAIKVKLINSINRYPQ